jgi:hypothetical protein
MKTPKGFKLYIPRSKSRGEGKGLEGLGQPFCYSKKWLERLNNTFGEEPSCDA